MRWLKNYTYFKESNKENIQITEVIEEKSNYSSKNLISEICVSMILLNNEFLDPILDGGKKSRYSENSQAFLTDLKNLILKRNRLKLGKFIDGKCVEDEEISKVNIFDEVKFSIEDDWEKLVNSRIIARNIIDKIIPDDKLRQEQIRSIYWIGPNSTKEYPEDIVIELEDDRQLSFFINKNLGLSKSASFNTFADEIIGEELDGLYKGEYLTKWDEVTKIWIKNIYENANKNIQIHIEKFIDLSRLDNIGYFEYYNIIHRDPMYKNLGEHIKEFDKNILKFSELMSEIWKNRESCFIDPNLVYRTWMETKISIINSKILEHLFTESITKNNIDEIKKLDGMKLTEGVIKMKFMKTFVEKIGCLDRTIYYLGNNGNNFHNLPNRSFFRENYDDLSIKFDYHVKMLIDNDEEENNDFTIKLLLELDDKLLISCDISIRFSGGEMSGKLSAKYKFEPSDDFNIRVSNKMLKIQNED